MTFRELVTAQFIDVSKKYPDLALCFGVDGAEIYGTIAFRRRISGNWISDRYQVNIRVPVGYPNEFPETLDTGGRIPADFHINPGNLLCLEVPIRIELEFRDNPTLIYYIDNFVIDYLTTYTYMRRFGKLPFGERAHGSKGKMQFYEELFQIKKWDIILDYLKMLANLQYRGHRRCYCGSGKRLRNCHREKMSKWIQADKLRLFREDFFEIRDYLKSKGAS